jgi:hypothetical protein
LVPDSYREARFDINYTVANSLGVWRKFVELLANLGRALSICTLAVLPFAFGPAKASVAIPSHFLGCTVGDGALSFDPCSMGTLQLPDPGNGIEGISFGGSPQVFASPLGVDHFEFIAVPASGPPRIDLMPGVEIPWSYNFGLGSTDPGIALSWNLTFGFSAICADYNVTISGAGLGAFAGNGSTVTQPKPTCDPQGDGSDSYVLFDATVTSIQNGATLSANFPWGSVQINPLTAIPEPVSFSLFLSSLGCLALIKKWLAR